VFGCLLTDSTSYLILPLRLPQKSSGNFTVWRTQCAAGILVGMPKKPPFPIGLTVDEALQRGWRPGLGRKLFAGDDEVIREPGPGDGWIAPQPKRRRRWSSSDSPRARIRSVMERWRAAERERKRMRRHKHKPKRGSKAIIRALLPAPSDEATPCPTKERDTSDANVTRSRPATRSGPALNVPLGSVAASDQTIVVEMEFTPGVIAVPRRRGFLTGETPDDIAAAVFGMLVEAVEAGIRARPAPPLPPAAVSTSTSRSMPAPAAPPPAAEPSPPPASHPQGAPCAQVGPPRGR
jgi:hypothetical protein